MGLLFLCQCLKAVSKQFSIIIAVEYDFVVLVLPRPVQYPNGNKYLSSMTVALAES